MRGLCFSLFSFISAAVDNAPTRAILGIRSFSANVPQTAAIGISDYAFITFPYRVYGADYDWLSVRCVNSDGSEPDPKEFAN